MRVRRVVEYSGPEEDVKRHLDNTLLSLLPVLTPGTCVPYRAPQIHDSDEGDEPLMAWTFHGAKGAPQVTIRLLEEEVT